MAVGQSCYGRRDSTPVAWLFSALFGSWFIWHLGIRRNLGWENLGSRAVQSVRVSSLLLRWDTRVVFGFILSVTGRPLGERLEFQSLMVLEGWKLSRGVQSWGLWEVTGLHWLIRMEPSWVKVLPRTLAM